VVIREVRNSSLLHVPRGIRDRISITFDESRISEVGQIEAEIFNGGSETIQNPRFTLTLPEGAKILDALLTPNEGAPASVIGENFVEVRVNYLNPVREHNHRLTLSLLVDGDTAPVKATGSGEGWSVRYSTAEAWKVDTQRLYPGLSCA
jgi:hypothetical protein